MWHKGDSLHAHFARQLQQKIVRRVAAQHRLARSAASCTAASLQDLEEHVSGETAREAAADLLQERLLLRQLGQPPLHHLLPVESSTTHRLAGETQSRSLQHRCQPHHLAPIGMDGLQRCRGWVVIP